MAENDFLKSPRIKANLQLDCLSPNELFVRDDEGARHLFQGAVFVHLSHWLKVHLSHEEIVERSAHQFSAEELYYALYQFKNLGIIYEEEKGVDFPSEWVSLLETYSLSASDAADKLKKCPIGFEAISGEDLSDILPFFEKYPFSREAQPKLKIVLTDHYRRKELLDWSCKAKEENIAWLLASAIARISNGESLSDLFQYK